MISFSQSQTQTVQSKDILGDTLNHFLISYRLISFDRFRNNVKHIKIPYDDGCFYLTRAIAFGSVKVSSIFPLVDGPGLQGLFFLIHSVASITYLKKGSCCTHAFNKGNTCNVHFSMER